MKTKIQIITNMREAFIRAGLVPEGKAGIIICPGWNARLSFKTANKLKEEGILV